MATGNVRFSRPVVLLGAVAGVCLYSCVAAFFQVMRYGRLGMLWTVINMAIAVPAAVSIIFWGERLGLWACIGFILTIFIAIELAESVEVYLTENDFHGEIVVLVALIAMSRKVILLEYDKYDPLVYLGIAGIIAALAGAYYMLKRARKTDFAYAAAERTGLPPSTDED